MLYLVSLLTTEEKPSGLKALEELDILGETLLKQSLPSSCKVGSQFNKYLIFIIWVFDCKIQ